MKGKMLLMVTAALVSVMALCLIAGCSGNSDETAEVESQTQTVGANGTGIEAIAIGTASEGGKGVLVENATGSNIDAVSVTAVLQGYGGESESGEAQNLEIEGGKWAADDFARLYFPLTGSAIYDVQLASGDTSYTLHGVSSDELDGVNGKTTLKVDGAIAYLEYEKDGKLTSTLDQEKATAEEEAKAAEEAALQEQAAAEESAVESPASGSTSYDDAVTYYDNNSTTYNDASSGGATSDPGQSGDACVDDVVLNY